MTTAPTPSLEWLMTFDEGRAWLDVLPSRLESVSRAWSVEVTGGAFDGGTCGLVVPVTGRGGLDAVLKLQFPHDESAHEADALRVWNGNGAIRLLDHDPANDALLLERCRPGLPLSSAASTTALDVVAEVVAQLSIGVDNDAFPRLTDEAARWRDRLRPNWDGAGRPFGEDIVEQTTTFIDELLLSAPDEAVLLHQDLHGDNVLSAERDSWLAIDPKPIVGERAFALAPIVRSGELGHNRAAVVGRLDELSEKVRVDRERARRWTIVQTMAWGFDNDHVIEGHLDVVRWLLAEG